jgi:hypothetical protein
MRSACSFIYLFIQLVYRTEGTMQIFIISSYHTKLCFRYHSLASQPSTSSTQPLPSHRRTCLEIPPPPPLSPCLPTSAPLASTLMPPHLSTAASTRHESSPSRLPQSRFPLLPHPLATSLHKFAPGCASSCRRCPSLFHRSSCCLVDPTALSAARRSNRCMRGSVRP